MSAPQETFWQPDLLPIEDVQYVALLDENTKIIQKLGYNERDELTDWAVVQQCRRDGAWCTVGLYDNCHYKGVHRHLYNRYGQQFDEYLIMAVTSYDDVGLGLDTVLGWLDSNWLENERRSNRGY